MAIIMSGPAAKNPAEITGRMRATSAMTTGFYEGRSDRLGEDSHASLQNEAVAEGRKGGCPKAGIAAQEGTCAVVVPVIVCIAWAKPKSGTEGEGDQPRDDAVGRDGRVVVGRLDPLQRGDDRARSEREPDEVDALRQTSG